MYQKHLEPVIKQFTTGDFYKEVCQAKQEYFDRAGIVYEDDAEYENRMNTFMDWYVFDRELPGIDLPPIKLYVRKNAEKLSTEEADIYRGFCSTNLSIFYLKKAGGGVVCVKDLFSRKSYEVRDADVNMGFMRGDIFEARLIPFKGAYEFSRGFCFHPVEMERFILGEIKKVRSQDRARQVKLILQLSAMKLKHTRFQHIGIKHIYTLEPKF